MLKSFKHGPHFCPICCERHGWRCRDLPATLQFALPLDNAGDLPEVLMLDMDSYEAFRLQSFRTARARRFDLGDTTVWDIPF